MGEGPGVRGQGLRRTFQKDVETSSVPDEGGFMGSTCAPLVLAALFLLLAGQAAGAPPELPPITDQERSLTQVEGHPNAPAVVLFRKGNFSMVDPVTRAYRPTFTVTVRRKILTEEGKRYVPWGLRPSPSRSRQTAAFCRSSSPSPIATKWSSPSAGRKAGSPRRSRGSLRHESPLGAAVVTVELDEAKRSLTYRRRFDVLSRANGKEFYVALQSLFGAMEGSDAEAVVMRRR